MTLRKGRIVAVHPEDHSVDIMMVDDGSRLTGVQVSSHSAGSRSGVHNMPRPDKLDDDTKWDLTKQKDSDVYALVDFINGRNPVVTGYMFPQIGEMTFNDGREISRHGSDVYSTTDENGNFQWCHPGGAYIRIGESTEKEDLTGKDFDKKFKITRNTDKSVNIHIEQANNTVSVNIAPDGNVKVTTQKSVEITASEHVHVTASDHVTVTSPLVTLDAAHVHCTGDVNVDGDVFAGNVSLKHHVHTGVMAGPSLTGEPQQ